MAVVHYTTLQAIRKTANLQKLKKLDTLQGAVDGTNRIFYTNKAPIVDSNNDDVVDTTDFVVFVGGTPLAAAAITSVDAYNGIITLVAAPTNGSTVKATYNYSPCSDTTLATARTQAESWLNRRVRSFTDLTKIATTADAPGDWSAIIELRAAGKLLINDYGASADTDGSSKDGYLKLNAAKDMLAEYISDVQDDVDALQPNVVSSASQGTLFCPPGTDRTDAFFHDPDLDNSDDELINVTVGPL